MNDTVSEYLILNDTFLDLFNKIIPENPNFNTIYGRTGLFRYELDDIRNAWTQQNDYCCPWNQDYALLLALRHIQTQENVEQLLELVKDDITYPARFNQYLEDMFNYIWDTYKDNPRISEAFGRPGGIPSSNDFNENPSFIG